MSLLMEALRKAEAAKNKADGKDVDKKNKETLEPAEAEVSHSPAQKTTTDQQAKEVPPTDHIESFQFELEPKAPNERSLQSDPAPEATPADGSTDSDNADLGNFLEPDKETDNSDAVSLEGPDEFDSAIPSLDYNESYDEELAKARNEILDTLDNQAGADELYGFIPDEDAAAGLTTEQTTEQLSEKLDNDDANEALEVAEEYNQYERSKHQGAGSNRGMDQAVLDRQTANSLFQAKQNSRITKRNKLIMLGLLLALLPIGGGGFYWYYSTSLNNSSLFPISAEFPQRPEGFLGEVTPATTLADVETAVETVVETDEPVLPESNSPDIIDTSIASNTEPTEVPEAVQPLPASPTPIEPVIAGNAAPVAPPQATNPSGALINSDFPGQAVPEIKLTRTLARREVNPDLLAAYESYQQSDFAQARRLYSQVLNTQPNNRDALLGLALINRQEGNITQAQSLYSRLLQLNPRDPLARAGLLQSSQGANTSQQESELRALQREFPNVAPLAFALGNLYASQARWNEAQNAYFDALRIASEVDSDSVSPDYAFNLAVSLERLNQLALAYDYYQQALELSSTAPSGFSMENLNQRLNYLERALQ
tara:strand:- start:86432 stop:88225 length:1794 start_codon:yes stop_codon:yes gene_type:complete